MATKKKLLQAAAGSAGGAGLNVEEVFSTYLYDGTGATQTITNGIDLAGEGGLVWLKARSAANWHGLYDTDRGINKFLATNVSNAEISAANTLTSFNSDGFTIGAIENSNFSGETAVSWTFRKAPKFFTCLTYSGTGSAQNISHDLGSDVGFLLIKRTDNTGNWRCWHRGLPGTGSNMEFNQTGAYETSTTIFNGTDPTSTQFSVGTNSNVNASGGTYVAYLFAHNDDDGEFGPDGDADIIKCGSYTGNGSSTGPEIDLGFEPQWVMIKRSDNTGGWFLIDTMRGWTNSSGDDPFLRAESSQIEYANPYVKPLATGFQLQTSNTQFNASGGNFIYIAIRRGPMAVPTDATDVFDVDAEDSGSSNNPPLYVSGFPVDFALRKQTNSSANWAAVSRLTGTNYLQTNSTAAESSVASYEFDYMNGWSSDAGWNAAIYSWMWKRAPNFFDAVAYTGNDTAGRTVAHNLGVVPEMIWVKNRSAAVEWAVYHKDVSLGFLKLNTSDAKIGGYVFGASSSNDDQSATNIILSSGNAVNELNKNYIAYLFASLDGVSKVGSFTYAGTTLNVDCGFSAGARFVLYKRYNTTGSWLVLDSERGINASANDPVLYLNATDAEDSGYNLIEPYSAGFTITGNDVGNGDYIFYAIA